MAVAKTERAPARQKPRVDVPVVEFKDVTKVYDGGSVAVQSASMRIGRGEFVFLVGPTGCGKSTCIRLLMKELEPSRGEVSIAGRPLSEVPRSRVPYLRRNIGVVFQDYKLLPNRTVYDNVAYSLQVIGESRKEIRRKVPDILRLVGLSTKLHNFPNELSGGEQQRVSVARAFVNHPPLLLADEPTGNLDPETSIGIMQLIYRINRTGTTVIVATHDKEMVDKMRRRVVELREGRIVRDEQSGLYRPDESTTEFAIRLRGELGIGAEGHPNEPMRPAFFLREALRGLRRSSAPALAALLTVLLTAVVLGVFIPIVQATTGTANEVRSRVVVDVYIKESATPAEQGDLRRAIEETANVKSVDYISKAEALERAQDKNPQAFREGAELLGSNPLPASFRVTPEDPDKLDQIVERLNAGGQPQLAAIDEVRDREEDTDKILSATGLVKALTAGMAALLVLASIALIANTIRLSVFARRREVEVMKLVGATNWFIRWPFVIEGMIVGFFGGLLAVLLLAILKTTFVDPLSDRFALLAAPDTIDFPLLVIVLMGACIAVSALGSGITLRRFLRV